MSGTLEGVMGENTTGGVCGGVLPATAWETSWGVPGTAINAGIGAKASLIVG